MSDTYPDTPTPIDPLIDDIDWHTFDCPCDSCTVDRLLDLQEDRAA